MTPVEFLKTIYLGDRACKAILIDSWNRRVEIVVTKISRIRSNTGSWNYYSDEDIVDGRIVLSGVESCGILPPLLPNDLINHMSVSRVADSMNLWEFTFLISSVPEVTRAEDVVFTEVTVRVVATEVHLEDPMRSGVEIRE